MSSGTPELSTASPCIVDLPEWSEWRIAV